MALDHQPRGLDEPMAWKGLHGENIWKNKNEEKEKYEEKKVPKFGVKILQASHFGARNERFQSAKMCSKFYSTPTNGSKSG